MPVDLTKPFEWRPYRVQNIGTTRTTLNYRVSAMDAPIECGYAEDGAAKNKAFQLNETFAFAAVAALERAREEIRAARLAHPQDDPVGYLESLSIITRLLESRP